MILLCIDSHSKWPEAFIATNMSEANTIESFKDLFSRYRYPSHLVTDNLQSFVRQKFKDFYVEIGLFFYTILVHKIK